MQHSLDSLAEEEFDSLYVNVSVSNKTCGIDFASDQQRKAFLDSLKEKL